MEATAAAGVIGAISEVWDYPDGRLEPTLDARMRVIREIREFKPDLVLTHRPDDYHPDHRAVGHLVRDASYLITVPGIVPDVPILHRSPIIGYLPDHFTRPYPLAPDVIVDVTAHVSTIVEMLACHESQFYEWLPFNQGTLEQVPAPEGNRKHWLRQWYSQWFHVTTDRYREELIHQFGQQRGETMQFVEIFEISEYGSPLDETSRDRLFGFATSS